MYNYFDKKKEQKKEDYITTMRPVLTAKINLVADDFKALAETGKAIDFFESNLTKKQREEDNLIR